MKRLTEIRSYKLKPGMARRFHTVMVEEAVPLFRQSGTDVIAFGESLHEPDTYYLIRAYADLDEMRTSQRAFFGSDAWIRGSRDWCLQQIESYLSTVIWLPAATVEGLREANQ